MSLGTGAFGERLRRERELRQITLEEISGSTKISKRHLQALEQEDFDSLPGGIFNKGFVRAYARYVGIDEEQAVTDYMAADTQEAPAEPKFPLEVHKSVDLNPKRSYAPIILALLALIVILGGWTYWKHRPQQGAPPVNPAGPRTSNSGSSAATAKDTSVPISEPAPSTTDKGQFTVVVTANESSWISIKADGRTATGRIFNAGEEQSVSATREIALTLGNAGGVEVKFNGATQGVMGQEGKPRTLIFTPGGLQNKPVP